MVQERAKARARAKPNPKAEGKVKETLEKAKATIERTDGSKRRLRPMELVEKR
jgi:hypothetical protein